MSHGVIKGIFIDSFDNEYSFCEEKQKRHTGEHAMAQAKLSEGKFYIPL